MAAAIVIAIIIAVAMIVIAIFVIIAMIIVASSIAIVTTVSTHTYIAVLVVRALGLEIELLELAICAWAACSTIDRVTDELREPLKAKSVERVEVG